MKSVCSTSLNLVVAEPGDSMGLEESALVWEKKLFSDEGSVLIGVVTTRGIKPSEASKSSAPKSAPKPNEAFCRMS